MGSCAKALSGRQTCRQASGAQRPGHDQRSTPSSMCKLRVASGLAAGGLLAHKRKDGTDAPSTRQLGRKIRGRRPAGHQAAAASCEAAPQRAFCTSVSVVCRRWAVWLAPVKTERDFRSQCGRYGNDGNGASVLVQGNDHDADANADKTVEDALS